jgi:hypothetical protein
MIHRLMQGLPIEPLPVRPVPQVMPITTTGTGYCCKTPQPLGRHAGQVCQLPGIALDCRPDVELHSGIPDADLIPEQSP